LLGDRRAVSCRSRSNDARLPARSAAAGLDAKLEEKRVKLEQLKTWQQLVENRLRYVASKQVRREDTRRKILIGAVILGKIERKEFDEKKLRATLDEALTRADDRALFGLT
jgi:hypothetical protein